MSPKGSLLFITGGEILAKLNTVERVEQIVKPIAVELGYDLWDVRFAKEGADW